MDNERIDLLARKQYIESWVDKIYDEENHKGLKALFPEPIASFKQYALDMFLNTNLSYEQIDESMSALIMERKKAYDEKIAEAKREQEARAIENIDSKIDNIVQEFVQPQNDELEKADANPIVLDVNPEVVSINTEPVVDNGLTAMMNDNTPTVEIKEEKSKQFVKSNNSTKKQAGSISLFSICLSMLAIAAFVLIAMILNLLLK